MLIEDNSFVITDWMLNCLNECRMPNDKQLAPSDYQANIDSVTAELGRRPGDIGETRRVQELLEKRQREVASQGAKARRKKGPQSLLPR
jgi:hypothetical protein